MAVIERWRCGEVAVSGGSSVSSKMQMRLLGIFGIFFSNCCVIDL